MLLLTFALLCFSWSRLAGYQLADSVEYMDRAWTGTQSYTVLFDGDVPLHVSHKVRGVLFMLAFATPDYHTH